MYVYVVRKIHIHIVVYILVHFIAYVTVINGTMHDMKSKDDLEMSNAQVGLLNIHRLTNVWNCGLHP